MIAQWLVGTAEAEANVIFDRVGLHCELGIILAGYS